MRKRFLLAIAAGLISVSARAALVFNFTASSGNVPPDAMTAIALAGQRWSSVLSDNLTININIDFTSLPGTAIAQSNFSSIGKTYSAVVTALNQKASTPNDSIAVAHLQSGSSFNFLINNPSTGAVVVDNNNTLNNTGIWMTRANAKALGFLSATAPNDGSIQFNSNLAFDFDPTNGIESNKVDFVSDATHEIGHILGFDSVVDRVDADTEPNGPNAPASVESLPPYTLDLFRYSASSAAQGIEDLSVGGSKYFSIDGGATSIAAFSTGAYNGDGYQPEHWKQGQNLGVMDPAFSYGQSKFISANDIEAMDVIGYTAVVPEPGSLGCLALSALLLKRRR